MYADNTHVLLRFTIADRSMEERCIKYLNDEGVKWPTVWRLLSGGVVYAPHERGRSGERTDDDALLFASYTVSRNSDHIFVFELTRAYGSTIAEIIVAHLW